MEASPEQMVDPRLRGELSDKPVHHGAKSSTSTPGTAAPSASASPSSRSAASPVQGHQQQPQQLLSRRQYHNHSPSQQQQPPPAPTAQWQLHPHHQPSLSQAQAQVQARADAQASAHQHPPAPQQSAQQSSQHGGPVSEFSPGDSASLTPSTPAGGYAAHTDTTHTLDGTPNDADAKKPRACESCRGLKVRCEPEPAHPDGPCKRCAKANRACVVTQPTRKRQKKTDNRVAELEKKIDALTASLQATRGSTGAAVSSPAIAPAPLPQLAINPRSPTLSRAQPIAPSSSTSRTASHSQTEYDSPSRAQREWTQYPTSQHSGPSQPSSSSYAPGSGVNHDYHRHPTNLLPPITSTAGQKRKHGDAVPSDVREPSSTSTPQPRALNADQPDIVDRGLLTMLQACEFFARYTDQMAPHLPGVVFPSNMTAAELRRSKPTLFLAIMATASSNFPHLQRTLTSELMQVFAERVIVTGSKSLELVQALQVAVIWYYPPEHFEELKFYQLLHIAAVMAIDLGLGNKKQFKGGFRKHLPIHWRDHPLRKRPMEDPTTLEARRAWLTCYFLATNSSMALHRPNLIRWTPFMAECVDVLESSPDAAPTDGYFCQLIWAHRLAEDVGIQFSMDDPASTPNISEPRTQYTLKGFERELERHVQSVPKEKMQPSLKMTFHVLNLYMHEIATSGEFSDNFSPGVGPQRQGEEGDGTNGNGLGSDAPLTSAHINAMSACLSAVDGIFETFLSLDVSSIRCLPVFNFVRVAYAVVVLMKIYFAASSPKSELGRVINKDNMKVESHLEALLDKFGATAADDRSRPASKFLVVLVMLRSWFQKQKGQQGDDKPGTRTNTPGPGNLLRESEGLPSMSERHRLSASQQQQEYTSTANTPLQLLSEIATSANNTPAPASRPTGSNISDLLTASASANTTSSNINSHRAPWTGRASAFVFDPAGAAEAAATVAAAHAADQANNSTTNTTTSGGGTATTSAAASANSLHWPENVSMFTPDFSEYANMADGFAHAMDLTLGGLTSTDGVFGGVMMGMMGYGLEGMSALSTGMGPGGGQGQARGGSGYASQQQGQTQDGHAAGPGQWYLPGPGATAGAAALDGMGGGYGF
ncbi:hypothetical protein V8F33_004572 [Rhypophila sp. PSN 637]